MTKRYFISGTDTEVGKTYATCLIMQALVGNGLKVAGLKPVASDSRWIQDNDELVLRNQDALNIQKASNLSLAYSKVNPIVFEEPIAPHIAAKSAAIELSVHELNQNVECPDADIIFIEGAGGWLTPLNDKETYADWVEQNQLEVILVVGMKLGCLNHAQLTAKAIRAQGLTIKGWVANQIDADMKNYQDNLSWLKNYFDEPMIAEIKYQQSIENFEARGLVELLD